MLGETVNMTNPAKAKLQLPKNSFLCCVLFCSVLRKTRHCLKCSFSSTEWTDLLSELPVVGPNNIYHLKRVFSRSLFQRVWVRVDHSGTCLSVHNLVINLKWRVQKWTVKRWQWKSAMERLMDWEICIHPPTHLREYPSAVNNNLSLCYSQRSNIYTLITRHLRHLSGQTNEIINKASTVQ